MSDSTVPVAAPGKGADPRSDRAQYSSEIAEGLIRDFHPATVLDVGCRTGDLVEELRGRGVDASGIDASEQAISQARELAAEHCRVAAPTEPIEGHYDLLTCVEVLGHLSPADADKAIASFCSAGDTVVVSSAPAEPNPLPPEDLAARFAEHDFMRSLDRDLSYISPWAAAFVRGNENHIETVRRYDRAWLRLRDEVAEVRRSLQDHRQRLAKLEGETEAGGRAELAEKLEQNQAEILRLRDLLIGKEAELGVAVGRVAEHKARGDWHTMLQHRRNQIRGMLARIPGLKRLLRLIRPR